VFGNGHAALDAHTDSLHGLGFPGEQLLEKGHDGLPSVNETEKVAVRFAERGAEIRRTCKNLRSRIV
jgi:hypothetical protein